eukprot:5216197-Lingulodinium_polyedra.AAC.1
MRAASGCAPAAPGAGSGASAVPSAFSPFAPRASGGSRTLVGRTLTTRLPRPSTAPLTRT